jgi:hypothetical protein
VILRGLCDIDEWGGVVLCKREGGGGLGIVQDKVGGFGCCAGGG